MANVKISEMPAATGISADDVMPIVQGGTNKKLSYSVLKTQQQKGYNCYNWYNSTDRTLDTNYTKLDGRAITSKECFSWNARYIYLWKK